ncbi:MAG: 30S ribosomal protein S9 [Minisyncoccales bacterium]
MKKEKFIEATGRRKTAVARVRIFLDKKGFLVNHKDPKDYFPSFVEVEKILSPLKILKKENDLFVLAKVKGGGKSSQAEAIRLGLSRALVSLKEDFKKELKEAGFLKRDPRMRERKKFGLKRARRAPQWQKR